MILFVFSNNRNKSQAAGLDKLIELFSMHRTANQIVDKLRPSFNHFPSMDPYVWSWDTGLPGS